MSILKRQVDSSPNFLSLFNFMKDYCSVLCFSSDNTYFAQKEHVKMTVFETFNCSGQNSSNSSCKFWNSKSILLHILHPSSLPVDFKLILFYIELKDPIKIPILRLSITLVKICVFLMSLSKPQVFSNFVSPFSVMKDNSSVIFRSNIKYFAHFWL